MNSMLTHYNSTKQNETKQNKTKQNKTKQKQNKTKQQQQQQKTAILSTWLLCISCYKGYKFRVTGYFHVLGIVVRKDYSRHWTAFSFSSGCFKKLWEDFKANKGIIFDA